MIEQRRHIAPLDTNEWLVRPSRENVPVYTTLNFTLRAQPIGFDVTANEGGRLRKRFNFFAGFALGGGQAMNRHIGLGFCG